MVAIDPVAVGHYPYYFAFSAPMPFPIFEIYLLDPAVKLSHYRAKAAAAAHHKFSWLVLGPERAIRYHQERPPESSDIPRGVYRLWPKYWDWQLGIRPAENEKLKLVALQKPSGLGNWYDAQIPSIAVETPPTELHVASLWEGRQATVPVIHRRAACYAARDRKTVYLVVAKERVIRFTPDGAPQEVDSLPERRRVAFAKVSDWGGRWPC